MFVTLFLIACVSETPSAVLTGLHLLFSEHGVLKSLALLFVPGCIAFCMIASEFTLLQRTSVVTLSICGIFKEVVTISAAGIVFHDELSMVNISGLIVTIISIASYNYLKIMKMREEALEALRKKDEPRYVEVDVDGAFDAPTGADEVPTRKADTVPLMHDQESRIDGGTRADSGSGSTSRLEGMANGVPGSSAKRRQDMD